MKQANVSVIPSQANASVNSTAIDSNQLIACSVQATFSDASAAGTLKVQASNDSPNAEYLNTFVPTNWTDICGATIVVAGAGSYLIGKFDLCYQYIRVVYTNSAGSPAGTISAQMKTLSI